jgi:hypothetical protein
VSLPRRALILLLTSVFFAETAIAVTHASSGRPLRLLVGLDANASGWGGLGTSDRLRAIESQTGAKWLREAFLWSKIEPEPGRFDFSYFDHFLREAATKHVHVLPLLDGTPSWAGAHWNTIPTDPSAYSAYVAAVVGRYGPHGSFWTKHPELRGSAIWVFELWNEPYQDGGNDASYDPARYAALVKAAVTAGRAIDPSAKYTLAAEVTGQQIGRKWVPWIDALYQAVPDLNRYFDAVAIHPYGPDATGLTQQGFGQLRRTERMRAAFVRHGAGGKPFWITEIGWPTCTQEAGCVTAAEQATNLQTLFRYLHTRWATYVKAVFVYRYEDLNTASTEVEKSYGLTRTNYVAKPALSIFRAQARASA